MKRAEADIEEHERLLRTLNKTYGGRTSGMMVLRVVWRKYVQKIRTGWFYWAKRLFDIFASGALLLALSPLFLFLIVFIKRDGGPAFYSQTRIGRYGREFRFWKFRSMVPNADKMKKELMEQNEMEGGVIFKMKNDPRITPIGRIIRKLSIDELPQLWNVLRGDMSLVGPRPPLPNEVAHYTSEERRRLDAEQGITCIWQVSGRSDIPFDDQVKLDVEYIQNESLWNDIKLLLKTIPAVLLGKGAS
ncbi:Sugar transferase [Acanthopleuribacter pedis]|uniref:Sugar transferase n=2 Tax=Acanthopleuribacter pedis TaxID=442870 RepID=A0A8J7U4H3_9BACT|nr:sugar transferase [Acanthopleuribacter pedis]MBO1321483.1 sugar transferase [Acanthopleuribacter pedis]